MLSQLQLQRCGKYFGVSRSRRSCHTAEQQGKNILARKYSIFSAKFCPKNKTNFCKNTHFSWKYLIFVIFYFCQKMLLIFGKKYSFFRNYFLQENTCFWQKGYYFSLDCWKPRNVSGMDKKITFFDSWNFQGENHLTVTWKVADNIYQHIDVVEMQKDNAFSLGRILQIGDEVCFTLII